MAADPSPMLILLFAVAPLGLGPLSLAPLVLLAAFFA